MAEFFQLSTAERLDALDAAANTSGLLPHLLEKDIWVVWSLRHLFAGPYADHLVFKSGTSLSKAYGVIRSFSEDVDLTYDIRAIVVHLTPMAMAALTRRYATALDQHMADPLMLVPLAILDFLCIYPFPDDNGRMSRLLTLLLLYRLDYAVGRYISLERIFEASKEGYYETLEASSQGRHEGKHNITPWLDYFRGTPLRVYREFKERVGTAERGRGSKGDQVRTKALKRTQPFSSEIEETCSGVSRDMARLILRAMKAEGLIAPTGKGRSAKWVNQKVGT
ncbi:MAG: nucleotidyl transferase AbiEii/AbiGii toxin family protein [Porticoccaceae bacterium]